MVVLVPEADHRSKRKANENPHITIEERRDTRRIEEDRKECGGMYRK